MAFNFLSSPISTSPTTSLASSPRFGPESTILRDEETAITSPTIRSRNVKSEVDVDVGVEQEQEQDQEPEPERTVVTERSVLGVNSSSSQGEAEAGNEALSPISAAQSDIYTITTDIHVQPDPSFFAAETEADQTRISVSSPSSSSRSSSSLISSGSSGSSVSRGSKISDAGIKSLDVITNFQLPTSAPWPVVVDDSVLSSPTSSSAGSTITTTTHPQRRKRYTASEKGKAPEYSGRSWAETVNEKEYSGRRGGDEETENKNKRSRTRTRTRSLGEQEQKTAAAGMKKRPRSSRTSRDDSRCRKHKKIQEDGLSRDFLLLIALCVGFACAGILVVRPAFLAVSGVGDAFELWDD